MPLIGRFYPGITPMNVWDMPLQYWLLYIECVRAIEENH